MLENLLDIRFQVKKKKLFSKYNTLQTHKSGQVMLYSEWTFQMTSTRHMEKAYQIEAEGPQYPTYNLEVAEMRFWGRNASNFEMTICARYIDRHVVTSN